jgi:GNAT superfamily N-acetyltransferase
VLRAFVGDDALPAETIHITASDGTVTLSGSVELPYQRDEAETVRGFEHLGPESRYRRFLTPMHELDEKTLRYMTDLDHRDHEAMIALDESGEGVGVARYVRNNARPDTAEVAVTVVDGWQGRGLGTLLLQAISARARDEGVRTFTALMLASNHEMMDLFEHLGPVRIVGRAGGTVEIEVAIPPDAAAPRTARDGRQDDPCG